MFDVIKKYKPGNFDKKNNLKQPMVEFRLLYFTSPGLILALFHFYSIRFHQIFKQFETMVRLLFSRQTLPQYIGTLFGLLIFMILSQLGVLSNCSDSSATDESVTNMLSGAFNFSPVFLLTNSVFMPLFIDVFSQGHHLTSNQNYCTYAILNL